MKGHASANRTLTALKAARGQESFGATAQEWSEVTPLKGASRRRDLFLDVKQRRALLTHSQGVIHQLMKAAMSTGCRAGELTKARRSAFDARTNSLTVTGKTGTRAIPLAPVAVEFFTQISKA